ncbi:MAG TPA: VOC family protein, partial [Myxococcota bacterium]|nr:VOC family protein [Myxococcota bacterium]
MIGYVTLGTNDLDRAEKFYDALLAELGGKRVMTNERMRFYGSGPGQPMLAICKPHDGKRATSGNGTMVALAAGSQEAVDRVYKKAIALGATDEGAPGKRGEHFYGGYFRDADGNKFVAFVTGR